MGRKHTEETKAKLRAMRLGSLNPFYGKKHTKEFKDTRSVSYSGAGNPFYNKKHSEDTKNLLSTTRIGTMAGSKNPMFGKSRTPEEKRKISATRINTKVAKGSNNPNWRGGISKPRKSEMATTAYKQWRLAVFTRDNYTCQGCGRRGGNLEADHIKPWAYFLELRYELDNGRTLCVSCHRQTFKDIKQWRQNIKK